MAKEWFTIKQTDFSSGVNLIDDPTDLAEQELADVLNMRCTTHKTVVQREGYTAFNSSAITGTPEVRSIFNFRDYACFVQSGTYSPIPLVQTADGYLRKGSAAFPSTGNLTTSILTETASPLPAFMDAEWGTLIYLNGVDLPQIWEGTFAKCQGFRFTQDIGVTYMDFSSQVADEDPTTYAAIGGMDTAANGDWVIIKARVPKLTGIKVVMDGTNVNDIASALTVEYRSAAGTWTTVGVSLSDGTSASSKTFKQSGDITWTEVTCAPDLVDNSYGYFIRLSVSVALSATVRIRSIYLYYNVQALPSFWDGSFIKPDGFSVSSDTDVTYVDYTLKVTDDAMSTVATLGAFPITTGTFYIKSARKFRAARITMSLTNINTTASTLSAKYWNGTAWTALTIADGTSANSKTLAQSGLITWTWNTASQMRRLAIDTVPMYIIQFMVSATLSANVDVAEVDLIEYQDVLRPMTVGLYHKNRFFMAGRADAPNYLFYSAAFQPDVWTGIDSGYIGIPSGKPIIALSRFYNDLAIFTPDEIYILQGYTPSTFGLLKINTGGIGCVAAHSIVSAGKVLFFMHSSGFYIFDGVGVACISTKIRSFFRDDLTAYFIPVARFSHVQGRWNRVWATVEWTVSMGSTQATNNRILLFDIEHQGWWIDNIAASGFAKVESGAWQDLWYHGDYGGKLFRDYNGTADDATAISAYLTTRGIQITIPETASTAQRAYIGWLLLMRGMKAKFKTEAATSMTVQYAASGATSFTTLGTMSLIQSGVSYIVRELFDPISGTSFQLKFSQAVKDYSFTLTEWEASVTPVREFGVNV